MALRLASRLSSYPVSPPDRTLLGLSLLLELSEPKGQRAEYSAARVDCVHGQEPTSL